MGRFFTITEKQTRTRHQKRRKRIEYTDLKRGESWDWDEPKQILLAQMPAAGRGADCHRRCDHRRFRTGLGLGGFVWHWVGLLRDFLPTALIGREEFLCIYTLFLYLGGSATYSGAENNGT